MNKREDRKLWERKIHDIVSKYKQKRLGDSKLTQIWRFDGIRKLDADEERPSECVMKLVT